MGTGSLSLSLFLMLIFFSLGLSDVDRDRELMRREHEEFMKVHAGHEGMHAEMMLVLFVVMMLSQVLLVIWRKYVL